ncbi:TraB/VirB10 family protein [Alteromonas macleodii]|uniref:TraB/VirB10 family protein n=1 Tax=Alteromonas macleodii TaxID=28108 RepID=UPI003140BE00
MAEGKERKLEVKTPSKNEKKAKSKMLIIVAGLTLALVAIGSLTLAPEAKKPRPPKRSEFIDLTPGEDRDWRAEMTTQYKAMLKANRKIEENTDRSLALVEQALKKIKSQNGVVDKLSSRLKVLEERKPVERIVVREGAGSESSEIDTSELSIQDRIRMQLEAEERNRKPYEPKPTITKDEDAEQGSVVPQKPNRVLPPPPGMPYEKAKELGKLAQPVETLTRRNPKINKPLEQMIFVAKEDNYRDDAGSVDVETAYIENEYAGFIPPGSFAKVALLSGIDSGTSEYTRANPQPVLMRVQDNAMLPQGRYATKSCFVLGSSYGDLSSERVFVQLSRITCVDKARGMMLTGSISGFITDSDSIQGLKGKVIRRNGQLLGKAMLSGFATGLSEVAASAGTTQVTTVGGAINTALDTDRILETGGMKGIGSTMELISKQYLEEAKNMFPVISINGGRVGTMVLTQGSTLEWKSYTGKFEKRVRPTALHRDIF